MFKPTGVQPNQRTSRRRTVPLNSS